MSSLTEISELTAKALSLIQEVKKDSDAKDKTIASLLEKVRIRENEIVRLKTAMRDLATRTGLIDAEPIDF